MAADLLPILFNLRQFWLAKHQNMSQILERGVMVMQRFQDGGRDAFNIFRLTLLAQSTRFSKCG